MDGVLVIDKPKGPTSHDVVSAIRKSLGEKKVGHTGTLDPAATGVLPLVLGKATKVARYLSGSTKRYEAVFHFGKTTTTLDGEGDTLEERPVEITEEQVREALTELVGDIEQLPPMYSAKKVQGKRLYELARQGVHVEREPKKVHIDFIELLDFTGDEARVDVRCSAGTYVRVLAGDVGEKLGCGAYLKVLRRTEVGPFTLQDAVTLEDVVDHPDDVLDRVLPLTRALGGLPRIDLPNYMGRMVVSGHQLSVADLRALDTPTFEPDQALTLGLDGGELIAVARSLLSSEALSTSRRDERALKTERVLSRNG